MKSALLIPILFCTVLHAAEPAQRAQLVSHIYYPELIYRTSPIKVSEGNLLEAARTKDQRRFGAAYVAVFDEDRRKPKEDQQWRDPTFPWVAALRRCGIAFPEGTTVRWLPTYPPLLVTHTPAVISRIESLMDLKLKR